MSNNHLSVVLAAVILTFACVCANVALAGLSGPPASFVVPARDGKHMLVMLSPVPISEDEGNACTLPCGRQVNVRELFASSGVYEIGPPFAPVWTVNWYGEKESVHMSEEGRYVVRVNRFGGGGYGEPATAHWCVRFYDMGVQINQYDLNELMDYPSLMEFTSRDWHYLWIDNMFDAEVRDGYIVLKTTTRESYRFDVSTGEIVEQFRFWRWIARGSLAVVAVSVLLAGWFIYRRWITRTDRHP